MLTQKIGRKTGGIFHTGQNAATGEALEITPSTPTTMLIHGE
jgi:hypothetical protein